MWLVDRDVVSMSMSMMLGKRPEEEDRWLAKRGTRSMHMTREKAKESSETFRNNDDRCFAFQVDAPEIVCIRRISVSNAIGRQWHRYDPFPFFRGPKISLAKRHRVSTKTRRI
jgi:hypothetical protein